MGNAFQDQSLMNTIGPLDGLNPMPLFSPVKMSHIIYLANEALFRVDGRIFKDIVDENDPNNIITTHLVVLNS